MTRLLVLSLVAALLLTGCGPQPITQPGSPPPSPTADVDGVQPAGTPADVVTGLAAPWSILRISADEGGEMLTLVSERDSGVIEEVVGDGLQAIGTVPGVVHQGEGGLLGLAYLDDDGDHYLYAYVTAESDNRIVRMEFHEDHTLGEPEVVLDGLAKAGNHNGGRIAFGPDGMLYATVGDAGNPDSAQDPQSLNGKILRMTPTGDVPGDNPTTGSYVYSMGHRNPQGIAWDSDGQLWAAEFGQDTWDEFNRIVPGGNYGWPVVEGMSGGVSTGSTTDFIDPWAQWPTDDASPSGLAYLDGTFFLAGLGGQRLWAIYVDEQSETASAVPWFVQQYGRIRDVTPGPDGWLWMLTNNTDGRGSPLEGDDRILQVRLTPLAEG
ncbi:MAG: sorbosone dehydrogenase family protein [Microbacteriaceae bacterium]